MAREPEKDIQTSADETKSAARHAAAAAEVTKDSADETKTAARRTAVAAEVTKDSADRRTELAADRTVFAAERTYAAWVRTGLAALASGIGAKKLLEGMVAEWMVLTTGSLLVLFSAFCFGAAVWRHLFTGAPPPNPDVPRIPAALLVLVNGFLMLVALAALATIWFGRADGGS
jgi:putative membrane protein